MSIKKPLKFRGIDSVAYEMTIVTVCNILMVYRFNNLLYWCCQVSIHNIWIIFVIPEKETVRINLIIYGIL